VICLDLLIYQKDSTKDLLEIKTASVDLILTSPPYWNIVDYENSSQLGSGLTYKQFIRIFKKNLLECMRVLKEDSFGIFIVGDVRKGTKYTGKGSRPRMYSLQSDIIRYFTEMDFDFFSHIIWKKESVKKGEKGKIIYGSVGKGKYKDFVAPPYIYTDLSIEHILIFRKPGIKQEIPLLERLSDEHTRILKKDVEKWLDPVWYITPRRHSTHPATFPEELVERLIKMYSKKGDIVLDPFSGTGTTLKVALDLHRNAIGYEINEKYIHELTKSYPLKQQENVFSLQIST
jgi:DNA modification methylase